MIKVVIGKYDLSDYVSTISLEGDTTQFYRTLTLSMLYTQDGRSPAYKLEEGSPVVFSYEGKTRFLGYLFSQDMSSDGLTTVKAYDSNVYLSKSNDSRIFVRKKASEIIAILARDFGIDVGTIADTGYVIPYLRLSNQTIHDMVLKALTLTRNQTGRRFFIGNDKGKLTLNAGAHSQSYVFKDGSNLISATYSRSIEDTKTQVKVIGGPKGKETVVTVKDNAKREKYGVLQALEIMDESAASSQVKSRANTLMSEYSKVSEQFSIETLGVIEVDVGTPIYVINQMTGLSGGFYATAITHNFSAGLHTMSIQLTRTYELPSISINDDEVKK